MVLLLIALQTLQVGILWLHDWVPLGGLNDVAALRAHDSFARLVRVTLIQSVPFTIGLVASVFHVRQSPPAWLWGWLWISYALLFAGELRAWWWPYLVRSDPTRAMRYRASSDGRAPFCPSATALFPTRCTLSCTPPPPERCSRSPG